MTPNVFLATLINSVAVLALVQLIKAYIPILKLQYPWALPLIAAGIGPLVALVQTQLGDWLGVPVDLSTIAGIFAGGFATTINQFGKQLSKGEGSDASKKG